MAKLTDIPARDETTVALRPERLPKAALSADGKAPSMRIKNKAAVAGGVSFQLAEPFAGRATVNFHVCRNPGESDDEAVCRGLEEFVDGFLTIHAMIVARDKRKERR